MSGSSGPIVTLQIPLSSFCIACGAVDALAGQPHVAAFGAASRKVTRRSAEHLRASERPAAGLLSSDDAAPEREHDGWTARQKSRSFMGTSIAEDCNPFAEVAGLSEDQFGRHAATPTRRTTGTTDKHGFRATGFARSARSAYCTTDA